MSPLFFAALLAQDADRSALVRYQEVTTLEFPEQDLVGELVGPTGCVLYERKRGEFAPLITLRRDFNAEIADSAAIIGGATGI
jgi:hypothetical protein